MNTAPTLHPSISNHGHIWEGGSLDGQPFTLMTESTGDITTGTERYVYQTKKDFQGRWIWKLSIHPTKKKNLTE